MRTSGITGILSFVLWRFTRQVTGILDILTYALSSPPTDNDAGRLWLRVSLFPFTFSNLKVFKSRSVDFVMFCFAVVTHKHRNTYNITSSTVCHEESGNFENFLWRWGPHGDCVLRRDIRSYLLQAYEASIMATADLLCTFFRCTSDVIFTRYALGAHFFSASDVYHYTILSQLLGPMISVAFKILDLSVDRLSILVQALLTTMSPVVCENLQVRPLLNFSTLSFIPVQEICGISSLLPGDFILASF